MVHSTRRAIVLESGPVQTRLTELARTIWPITVRIWIHLLGIQHSMQWWRLQSML